MFAIIHVKGPCTIYGLNHYRLIIKYYIQGISNHNNKMPQGVARRVKLCTSKTKASFLSMANFTVKVVPVSLEPLVAQSFPLL